LPERKGDGYAIARDQVEVDAWRFEELLEHAGARVDPHERIRRLREALALWRGPALDEYAGADWAELEARRLAEVREVARERLLAARLEIGEAAMAVPEIEALLAEEPLREERWRLLALALYQAHRQADGLAALRRARQRLADELGVDPGPALRALEAQMLAQSPSLDAPAPAVQAALLGVEAPVPLPEGRIAQRPVQLVDREVELSELGLCLDSALDGIARLAVIQGPAGIGKTSLLHQVRDDARQRGATVLTARGSQLEKEFGFGVVRQLFDPVLTEPAIRETVLTGAATGATRVFDATHSPLDAPPESLFTILHGLYWLTSNLGAARW